MKRRILTAAFLASTTACYAEWDVPKTPRRDTCTQQTDVGYVYVQPMCPNQIPRNPRDFGDGR